MTTLATLEDIAQTIARIELIANEIHQKLTITGDQIVVIGGLSDISEDLGLIKAGEFRSGVGIPGKNFGTYTGFTGVRIGSPGWTYDSTRYAIVGLNQDVLKFGLSVEDGSILAQLGTIAGWTINDTQITKGNLIIDSSVPAIQTVDYSPGSIGFSINGAGDADFANVRVRGEIRATVLAYNELTATAGSQGVFKSAGRLKADVATLTSPTTFTIDIEDPASGHAQLFAVNDILRIQVGTTINWATVNSVSDQTTFYRYTVTKNSGGNTTFRAGTVVVDYGPAGQGFLYMSADDANGPFYSVRTHAGSPWSATSEKVRLGNMRNSFGAGANSRYGIGVGDYAGGNYLSYNGEAADTFILKVGGGAIKLDDDGARVICGTSYEDVRSFGFLKSNGTTFMGGVLGYTEFGSLQPNIKLECTSVSNESVVTSVIADCKYGAGGFSQLSLGSGYSGGDIPSAIFIIKDFSGKYAMMDLAADRGLSLSAFSGGSADLRIGGGLLVGDTTVAIDPAVGDVVYKTNLRPYRNSTQYTAYAYVPLATPLTSTSFDGDAFSNTAKTLIDLSTVYGVPPGVKAVDCYIAIRDSGSAATDCRLVLGATNTTNVGRNFDCSGLPNDTWERNNAIVPCDANGDIYYEIFASGEGTFDLYIQIFGYYL
jgi:hypothetical protein